MQVRTLFSVAILAITCIAWTSEDSPQLASSSPSPSGLADTPRACGGPQQTACSNPNEFCEVAPGNCSTRNAPGICRTKSEVCTRQMAPVCGCDGKTYNNDCERVKAGVTLARLGKCGA